MNELEKAEQRMGTRQETYAKPAIEVMEMEMEGCILTGSGDDGEDGGGAGRGF